MLHWALSWQWAGVGTPRGFQDRGGRVVAAVLDPDPHRPRTAYCQSRHLVVDPGFAPFESLTFAVSVCRHRNRDLYHGLLRLRPASPFRDKNLVCLQSGLVE